MAPSSSTSCTISERSAAAYCASVWSLAASSAASATSTAAASRPTVSGVHWFAVISGFSPAMQRVEQAVAQREILRLEIGGLGRGHRAATAPAAAACPRRSVPAPSRRSRCRRRIWCRRAWLSGATLPAASPVETISEASPAVLRSSQAICLIASNWSITASWWLTLAASVPDSLSSVVEQPVASYPYIPWRRPARRGAFGLAIVFPEFLLLRRQSS